MKKTILLSFTILLLITICNSSIYSQQSEVKISNIIFESDNSLTFDVYIENTGISTWTYSHGSVAWNYDISFLNGGTPLFSLVPGYSDFPSGAHPPSALITSPNVLRTSSNLPGSNGDILPDQSLRLYRFRLQTSAASFSSQYFNITWKHDVTPYTRIYGWNSGTGLPDEVGSIEFNIEQLFIDENFDYGEIANSDLTAVTSNWTRHSGTTGPAYSSSSLSYTDYPSSGVGGSLWFTFGSSGNNDGDVNRVLPASVTTDNNVYAAFLVNLDSARATADYFFHLGPEAIGTTFRGRVFARNNDTGWSLGLSKSSETRVDDNTVLNFQQTYLIVLKYSFSTAATNDDVVTLYVYETGIPASEPGSPIVTIGPTGSGTTSDPANIGSVAIRQGTNTPTGIIDGIRIGTTWAEIFSVAAGPTLIASPSALSGFNYVPGAGPSASQSFNLSGTDLAPSSGDITITGTDNYEVSLNDISFGANVNVGYSGGSLAATPVYVRLKAGLTVGSYNGEIITNAGGGATTVNVTCNGSVVKAEPTNHVTDFTGVNGTPPYYYINLSWIDASGGTEPDGYLIKRSSVDFASITDPVDGIFEVNTPFRLNVAQGVQILNYGLNADSTYFFKIYPYTNSGTLVNYKTDGTIPQFTLATAPAPSLPITENFNYATGSNLTDNGWLAHSGAGTNPIQVNENPLFYNGYINSGLGKSVSMTTSGEDVNRAFNTVTSGSVYASFMVNINSAQTAGDYFFHLGLENTTSLFYARVFVKKDGEDNLAFGIAKIANASVVYTPFNYSLNTTYLVVVKYTFNGGTTEDDEVKVWINPALNGIEPPSDLTHTETSNDALSLGMFALRQGSASNAASLTLGGIRIAQTWISEESSTFPLSVNVINGWNMVSAPGINPAGMSVSNWWSNLTGTVWGFNGTTYTSTTTTTPGKGYWMKNAGAEIYNYPAVEIVPNDPIPGHTGWNIIGVYENSVATSSLSTNPSGQITGTVWGFNGTTYVNMSGNTLEPGYGYWVKLLSDCDLIVSGALAKGSGVMAKYFKEDWGKIIITDAAGVSYTLFTVKGEVDLDQYEMPPAPPGGMFDVRFSSGRVAEDISTGFQSIELNGMEYPVKIRVENESIRLEDETGKTINSILKPGEEISINNNLINKLFISGDVIPDHFSLEQNYPNPFNPSTIIKFSIPKQTQLKINIYNMLGELVQTIANGLYEPGYYQVTFNAQNLSSGTYIYRIESHGFIQVKKMILIK